MSVALLIKLKEEAESRLLPIATEEAYRKQWVEPAAAYGLRWLPLFQTGHHVDASDLPKVMHEFHVMRQHFISVGALDLSARAQAVEAALAKALTHPGSIEVFIG